MKLCVIPARGGSKRIPRKNIKEFAGKPMIAWSILAAQNSHCFDSIWVSTDDQEIANIAQTYGASVPFSRPAHLSDDYATTVDVIAHSIKFYQDNFDKPLEYVCCIYATAPFISSQNLKQGLDIISSEDLDFVFSATNYVFPIQRAIKLVEDRVAMFEPQSFLTRSQDLEEAWHDAGQFYWGKPDAWLAKSPIFASNSKIVKLPHYQVQDIDTLDDWQRAELIHKAMYVKDSVSS